ncbi:signal transduction histidine kinase [Marmoricola sp. URHA0025 HA25]
MEVRRARSLAMVVAAADTAALLGILASERGLVAVGRSDLVSLRGEVWLILAGIAASAVVGFAVARSQPAHPVGWLFLGLAGAMLFSGVCEEWARWGLWARPGSTPGARVVAVVGDSSFIPWLVLVALILLRTPTGAYLSRRWRLLARLVVVAGVVSFSLGLVSGRVLSAPYDKVVNPWRVDAVQPTADWISYLSLLVVAGGLVASGVSILVRWRRSVGDERQQLLWLALVVAPLPLFVGASFLFSRADLTALTVISTGGFVVLVPVAAGLSITRYHLYDVERILARTTTYVLLTLLLVGTYGLIVWFGARGAQHGPTSPAIAATLGALAAAAIAAPAQRGIQRAIDRRFNRRQYEAKRLVRSELRRESAGLDVQDLLRRALGDPLVSVVHPGPGAQEWVSPDGEPVAAPETSEPVSRHGREVARVGFDPTATDPQTVHEVARIVAVELDNGRLRAELARRLTEVSSSRQRLAEAQRDERRRIERDLHDGAQQRLLALAFDLQSAQLSGDGTRMRDALAEGATAAQSAVRELRELANGLHPAALADGGLPAALDDLARHSPVRLSLAVDVGRLDPAVEFTAWLVIAEAVVNAQKHARASEVHLGVGRLDLALQVRVCDDGVGGANPDGPGLRGMRDRVEAAGGRLVVSSPAGQGTTIEAVLPCAS